MAQRERIHLTALGLAAARYRSVVADWNVDDALGYLPSRARGAKNSVQRNFLRQWRAASPELRRLLEITPRGREVCEAGVELLDATGAKAGCNRQIRSHRSVSCRLWRKQQWNQY
jgi:hypothetical protein